MGQSSGYSPVSGFPSTPSMDIPADIEKNVWGISSQFNAHCGSSDMSLFSSSLPVLPHEKYELGKEPVREIDLEEIEFLSDNEEELLAAIADDFDLSVLPNQVEDVEDYDIFGTGGGMELDFDPSVVSLAVSMAKTSIGSGYLGNGNAQNSMPNDVDSVSS